MVLTLNDADFFKVSSSGTQNLYTVFYWLNKISDYSLIFIDEFDSYYHFALAEYIVKTLQKDTKAQVLLTSHNTNLMTNRFMRPDCCFVISREGIKSFKDSTEMEVREGHNLERLYQGGAFGG
jgi:AAA15 family ATPase/GTPase